MPQCTPTEHNNKEKNFIFQKNTDASIILPFRSSDLMDLGV
jgi:hypothetical protein